MKKKKNQRQQFTRKHSKELRDEISALLTRSNLYLQPERRVAYATAIEVANRDLRKTRNSDASARVFSAIKAVSSFVSLSSKNKVTTSSLSNADLLPVGHPMSTKKHAMTASALRHARAQWIAADELVSDDVRSLVAAAHSAKPGSFERTHAFARLAALGPGKLPITAAVDIYYEDALAPITAAFGFGLGGNSRAARSARANLQRRDRLGRFAEQGGGFAFNIKGANGDIFGLSGRVVSQSGDENIEIEVAGHPELKDGIYSLPSTKGISVKAVLPQDVVAKLPENRKKKIVGDGDFIDLADVRSMDAPEGWKVAQTKFVGNYRFPGETEDNRAAAIYKSDDGYTAIKYQSGGISLHRAELDENKKSYRAEDKIGEQVGETQSSWADIQKLALSDQDDYEKELEKSDERYMAKAQAEDAAEKAARKVFMGDYIDNGDPVDDNHDFGDAPVDGWEKFDTSGSVGYEEQEESYDAWTHVAPDGYQVEEVYWDNERLNENDAFIVRDPEKNVVAEGLANWQEALEAIRDDKQSKKDKQADEERKAFMGDYQDNGGPVNEDHEFGDLPVDGWKTFDTSDSVGYEEQEESYRQWTHESPDGYQVIETNWNNEKLNDDGAFMVRDPEGNTIGENIFDWQEALETIQAEKQDRKELDRGEDVVQPPSGPGEPPTGGPGEPPSGPPSPRTGSEDDAKNFIAEVMDDADRLLNEGATLFEVTHGDIFERDINGNWTVKPDEPLFTLDDGRTISVEEEFDAWVLRDKNSNILAIVDISDDKPYDNIFREAERLNEKRENLLSEVGEIIRGASDEEEYYGLVEDAKEDGAITPEEHDAIVEALDKWKDRYDEIADVGDSEGFDSEYARNNIGNDFYSEVADILNRDDDEPPAPPGEPTGPPSAPRRQARQLVTDGLDGFAKANALPDNATVREWFDTLLQNVTPVNGKEYKDRFDSGDNFGHVPDSAQIYGGDEPGDNIIGKDENGQWSTWTSDGQKVELEDAATDTDWGTTDDGEGMDFADLRAYYKKPEDERNGNAWLDFHFFDESQPPSAFDEEQFDSLYTTPDGAYKPNVFDPYEPRGRKEGDSADYTDDPSVLANKFDRDQLVSALTDAVSPENGNEASGYGNLDFGNGDEQVPAEAIYNALELDGADAAGILARIYDEGLGDATNVDRISEMNKAIPAAEVTPADNLPSLIDREKENRRINREASRPMNAQVIIDNMEDHVETNRKISEIAQDIIEASESGVYEPDAFPRLLNEHLDLAYGSPDEKEAFAGLWGILLSLDGGSSSDDETKTSTFRKVVFDAVSNRAGADKAQEAYEDLIDEFGGFGEFGRDKMAIVNGTDDLESGSVGASFMRVIKEAAAPNEIKLQRSFGVSRYDDELLEQYTAEGGIISLDPRPFSEANYEGDTSWLGANTWAPDDFADHRFIFVAEPGELDSVSAVGLSWFEGEQEHIGYGQFEIEKVTRRKSGDPRRADEFVVKLRRADRGIEDIAAEETAATPEFTPRETLDLSNWRRTGDQTGGSNVGAFYEDENGQGYYVKVPKSQSHADNETLASVFYDELGVPSATVSKGEMDGELRVVSKLIPGAKGDLGAKVRNEDEEYLNKLRDGFAVDAWLSNWDVTGTGFDNVMSDENGDPVRVDPGGALMWRAQGEPKGSMFGDEVKELDTLRDPNMNHYSASVFSSMTDDDVRESAKKLIPMTPDRIDAIVDSVITDPDDAARIKERLKNRRQYILDRFDLKEEEAPQQLEEPISLGESMGYSARDLKPGDLTSDSFAIERVFTDEKTPNGKVSAVGYYPGRASQRLEFGQSDIVEAARGATLPPKGDGSPILKPNRPRNPTPPAFRGEIAKELSAAETWADVRDILNGRDLIAFDYETTGLGDGSNNMPVQLGAVRVRDGEIVDRFNVFMDPMENLSDWSLENLKDENGNPLTDEYLSQQIGMGEAHALFAEWAGADSVLVAHNTPFDREVLERINKQENVDFTPSGYIDTLRLGRDLVSKKSDENPDGTEGHRLPQLLAHYDIELGNWHTADADAEGTANLLSKLLNDAANKPDLDPRLLDFEGQERDYEQQAAEFADAENVYKDALAKYNVDKAVAAAWNCGFKAAADDDNNCNVPSVDDLIESSTVKPGDLTDPEALTSGDPQSDKNPLDVGPTDAATDKYPIDGEAYPPTAQQQEIINTFIDNPDQDIVVRAAAGAGKTSTLLALAKRIQQYAPEKKIVYIAFNRSVADEARDKMPSNVEVRTADSISFNWVKQNYPELLKKHGSKEALVYPKDIVAHLGIPEVLVKDEDGKSKSVKDKDRVRAVRKAVYNFTISSDKELGPQHFDLEDVAEPSPELVAAARRWWEDTMSPNGKMPFNFNHMKKMWSLSEPDLNSADSGLTRGADIVFVDEFQDTNDVLGVVVANQPSTQNIYVGDENQAIYQFMGANDWLQKVTVDSDLPLTQSFRFGKNIANIANKFLVFKENIHGRKTFRVEGAGRDPGTIVPTGSMKDADVVLVRSNAGAFKDVRAELNEGRTVGVTKGFKKDLDEFIVGVEWLMSDENTRGSRPSRMPEDLQQFKTWKEVLDEANSSDSELGRKAQILVGDVEQIGLDGLKELASRLKVINGAGDKKDFGGSPELPDDLSPGVSGDLGSEVTFNVTDDKIVLDGKTFPVKDKIKKANGGNAVWDKELSKWVVPAKTDSQRKAALEKLQTLINGSQKPGEVDVVVTTVHQAKGLEWGNARMGGDFPRPRKNKKTGQMEYPSEPEIHLAYVAVTRAERNLDLGSLDWINDFVPYDVPVETPEAPEVPEAVAVEEVGTVDATPEVPAVEVADKEVVSGDRETDLDQWLSGVDEAIADTVDKNNSVVKPSIKKEVSQAADEFAKVKEALANGDITDEEAIARINTIIDSLPETTGETSDYIWVIQDYMEGVTRILSGEYYDRPTGPDLPPKEFPGGYSSDGVFIVPNMRVRDKWGYSGFVMRYNKKGWNYVYFQRDIDGKQAQKNTRHLTTIAEDDSKPWVYSPNVPPGKRPPGWEDMVTPEEREKADAEAKAKADAKKAAAKAAKAAEKSTGEPAAGTTEALEKNVEEKAKEAEAELPKGEAPSGAKEAPAASIGFDEVKEAYKSAKFTEKSSKLPTEGLIDYVTYGTEDINGFLRAEEEEGDDEWEPEGYGKETIEDFVKEIDKIIDKSPTFDAPVTVYRGTVVKKDRVPKVGDTIKSPTYQSTSLSPQVAEDFSHIERHYSPHEIEIGNAENSVSVIYEIEVPPGEKFLSIPHFLPGIDERLAKDGEFADKDWKAEGVDGQQEVLLARGSSIEVLGVAKRQDGTMLVRGKLVQKGEAPSVESKAPEAEETTAPVDETEPEALDFSDPNLYEEVSIPSYKMPNDTPGIHAITSEEDIKNLDEIVKLGGRILFQVEDDPSIQTIYADNLTFNRNNWFLSSINKKIAVNKIVPIERIVDTLDTFDWETGELDETLIAPTDDGAGLFRESDGYFKAIRDFELLLAENAYIDAGTYMARLINELMRKRDLTDSMPMNNFDARDKHEKLKAAYNRTIEMLKTTYDPKLNSYVFSRLINNKKRFKVGYTEGWKSTIKPDRSGGTGRPNVIVENPKSLSESSFDDVKPLMSAIDSVVNKTDRVVGVSSAVDSGDIEDFQVRAVTVLDQETGERKIRLTFKLTAWAGRNQVQTMNQNIDAERQDEFGATWSKHDDMTVFSTSLADNGDVVVSTDKEFEYELGASTYKGRMKTSTGEKVSISILRASTTESLAAQYNGPRAFHNAVTIDLPLNATEEDVANALRASGVSNPRATEPADVKVLAENRLLSVFGRNVDPTKPIQNEKYRDERLKKIQKKWGVTPEDIKISTDSTGYITFTMPEYVAEKIVEATDTYALEHRLSVPGLRKIIRLSTPGFDDLTIEEQLVEETKAIVDIMTQDEKGLKATTGRFVEGKGSRGMSSASDIGTGGADYVFFYPRTEHTALKSVHDADHAVVLLFDPKKTYRRVDFYANSSDEYGAREDNSDFVKNAQAGKRADAEVLFKRGMSMDSAMGVVVSKRMRELILSELANRGIKEIAGIPVERFVTTQFKGRGRADKELSSWLSDYAINLDVTTNLMKEINNRLTGEEKLQFVDVTSLDSMVSREINNPIIVAFADDMSVIVRDKDTDTYVKVMMSPGEFSDVPLSLSDDELESIMQSMADNYGFYADATAYQGEVYKLPDETGNDKYMPVGSQISASTAIERLRLYERKHEEGSASDEQLAKYIFRFMFNNFSYQNDMVSGVIAKILNENPGIFYALKDIMSGKKKKTFKV